MGRDEQDRKTIDGMAADETGGTRDHDRPRRGRVIYKGCKGRCTQEGTC